MEKVLFINPCLLFANEVGLSIYSDNPPNYNDIKANIEEFGILQPLIVNEETNVVISGNVRLKIARELDLQSIPVIFVKISSISAELLAVSHGQHRVKTPSEILKERKILEVCFPVGKGGRTDLDKEKKKNKEIVDTLQKGVSKSSIQLLKSIDDLANELYKDDASKKEEIWKELDKQEVGIRKKYDELNGLKKESLKPKIVQMAIDPYFGNDLFKIYASSNSEMANLPEESIRCVFTSPPYFQMRDYGTGKEQRGLEKTIDAFIKGLVSDFEPCKRILTKDGSLWVNLGEGVVKKRYNAIPHRFAIAMMDAGWILNDELVWTKSNPVYNKNRRSIRSHEYFFHFVLSDQFFYNVEWLKSDHLSEDFKKNISIGLNGNNPRLVSGMGGYPSIITSPANNMVKLKNECEKLGLDFNHSAGMPISVPYIPILSTTEVGDIVLDPYSGTGTTGLVALQTGRKYIGYEISEEFAKTSLVRLKDFHDSELTNFLLQAA